MKPYFLVVHNYIMLRLKAFISKANIHAAKIEMLSRRTKVILNKGCTLTIGSNFVTDGRCVIIVDSDAKLEIGSHVYMNENAMISCKGKIFIGDGCKFGPNVNLFDNNHRFNPETGVSEEHTRGEISIGKGCWLGTNVVVLKGTHIGDNCIIGAGCVISGNIPAGSIVKRGRDLIIEPLRRD